MPKSDHEHLHVYSYNFELQQGHVRQTWMIYMVVTIVNH